MQEKQGVGTPAASSPATPNPAPGGGNVAAAAAVKAGAPAAAAAQPIGGHYIDAIFGGPPGGKSAPRPIRPAAAPALSAQEQQALAAQLHSGVPTGQTQTHPGRAAAACQGGAGLLLTAKGAGVGAGGGRGAPGKAQQLRPLPDRQQPLP